MSNLTTAVIPLVAMPLEVTKNKLTIRLLHQGVKGRLFAAAADKATKDHFGALSSNSNKLDAAAGCYVLSGNALIAGMCIVVKQ